MDTAPLNRQQRRQIGRKRTKVTALPGSLSASRSRSTARSLGTGIGALSAADETGGPSLADVAAEIPNPPPHFDNGASDDVPPADQPGPIFTGYKGKYGALKTGIVSTYGFVGTIVARYDQYDGLVIMGNAETIADAYIAWAKADPRVMRVLMVVFGSPIALVLGAHLVVANEIARHHGKSLGSLLGPVKLPGRAGTDIEPASRNSSSALAVPTPSPLPYQPVGPLAPTDAAPTPLPAASPSATSTAGDEIRVFPDEGLPADVEVLIRETARKLKRPYNEVRQEILVQIAQDQMAATNGHRMQQPGALGAPVAKE